jgi:hypothetical protein
MQRRLLGVLFLIVFLLLSVVFLILLLRSTVNKGTLPIPRIPAPVHFSPTPFMFTTYTPPLIEKKAVYKLVMIGDSMTAALGPHGGPLSDEMNTLYKERATSPQRIIIDNYAISSNILAVNEELTKQKTISEYTFPPLLSTDFDIILIESYGYNPLSQFGLSEGLKKQSLALDALMTTLITTHPHSLIIFVATIAPNRAIYAQKTQPNTSAQNRDKLADERIAYLKNHIDYATTHHIPLINIYEKSLTAAGDGDKKYINPTDDIHPSFAGVDFISHGIATFIYTNRYLPH